MYESVAYMPKSCSPLKYEIAYSGIFVFSDINASTTPSGELTSSKPHKRFLLKSGLSDVCTLALRASYPMVIANHPIIMTNNARMRLCVGINTRAKTSMENNPLAALEKEI